MALPNLLMKITSAFTDAKAALTTANAIGTTASAARDTANAANTAVTNLNAAAVHKAGAEEVSGVKTFTSATEFKGAVGFHTDKVYIHTQQDDGVDRSNQFLHASTDSSGYGTNLGFGAMGNTVVGGGESVISQIDELKGNNGENLYLVADGGIQIKVGAQTYSSAKLLNIGTDGIISGVITSAAKATSATTAGACTGNAATATSATKAGNATTVNGFTVSANVPAGAKFTDTTYGAGTAALVTAGTDTAQRTWTPKILHDYVAGATVTAANKVGTATVGSATVPVYISKGVPKECGVVASATMAAQAATITSTLPIAKGGTGLTSLATFVRTTGDQSIAGVKTYTSDAKYTIPGSDYRHLDFATSAVFGTAISGYQGWNMRLLDKAGSNAFCAYRAWLNSSSNVQHNWQLKRNSTNSELRMIEFTYAGSFCAFTPQTESIGLGSTSGQSVRWANEYFATAPNVSSDERIKESIGRVPDEVLDAWEDIDWKQFRFSDAVGKKGDAARLHNGLVAQQVGQAFSRHGLDAAKYGLFCHDEWDAQPAEYDGADLVSPAIEAGDLYSIRYEEALAMEAAYQRRRADRLEQRVAALEETVRRLANGAA